MVKNVLILLGMILYFPITSIAQEIPEDPSIFDYGKMWTFEDAPVDYWNETYGFDASPEWVDASRMSALRFASWCSASFVSPNGLIMTNHHCSNGEMPKLMKEGEDFNKNGFYAATLEEERKDEGLFVEQLVKIADITDEVQSYTSKTTDGAEMGAAIQSAYDAIKEKYSKMPGWENLRMQTISYYSGGKYSLYGYKRYDDIRLVFIPELDLGFYGGDPDNFTYPRYNLDCTFWRAYENGKPANTSAHYFKFNPDGANEGDPVFVIGNPGSTERYRTVAQLEYDREYRWNYRVESMTERHDELMVQYEKDPSPELLDEIFGLSNGMKAIGGIVEGLNDPILMGRKKKMEDQVRAAHKGKDYWSEIEKAYAGLAPHAAEVNLLSPSPLNGEIMTYMHKLSGYGKMLEVGGDETEIAEMKKGLMEGASVLSDKNELAKFGNLMNKLKRYASSDDTYLTSLLGAKNGSGFINGLVENSGFGSSKKIEKLLGAKKMSKGKDPLLKAANTLTTKYQDAATKFRAGGPDRRILENKVSNVVFEVHKGKLPPDATFTLRIADGVVAGYEYNGSKAPYKTTYFGLYDRHFSNNGEFPWSLPDRWKNPPTELLSKPMNFVSTNDIIGGNSGSPIINTKREVVGLIFDGNIESLPGNFIYEPTVNRAVSVHAGGITAALEYIYKADRLLKELRGN